MSTTFLEAQNPFFKTPKTPHGTFPFNELKNEHFLPAFKEGIRQHNLEIEKIAGNKQPPTFENTVVAMERSGSLLNRVTSVFFALNGAETNDDMQQIARELSPQLTDHSNAVMLNKKLFERVKVVYDKRQTLNLSVEDSMLLEKTYEGFASNGATLSAEKKEQFKALSKALNTATLTFGQNVLKETNSYSLFIRDKELLAGLPDDFLEMSAAKAEKINRKGYLLDLRATSFVPVMTYADNRDLRREIWTAYNTQCLSESAYNNTELIREITQLRLQIARLFGYENYAAYVLRRRMAENTQNVYALLNNLLTAYRPVALQELDEIQQYVDNNGGYFKVQAWDYVYYSEKLKNDVYDINDEMLKPYFELSNVKKGVFGLANKLYGLNFTKNSKIPVYHPEVEAYDVTDRDGKYLAVLYTDFHPREGKRSGAWMTEYQGQSRDAKGNDRRPHVTIVMNFTRPTGTKPALLTFNEVETFLHEFGHAIHGMVANGVYESLSGTNVYRDFVELPSQLMENWATQKDFLDDFAVHYQTGEKIPAELVKKLVDVANFNAGYACLRQLGFALQDMAFHTITSPVEGDIIAFENRAVATTALLPAVPGTGRSTTFSHIFSGGYAAGYYSYKWAEVLDADAFALFETNGIFDRATADSFLNNVLRKGGSEHPMTLYKHFRGHTPTIDALLKRNGIGVKK
ncbi:MAG: M3 family metallopeptidase [Prevotellaceae bacterium]|nr:M3 family metallopeptidase [Prevotellaceae bacterium]